MSLTLSRLFALALSLSTLATFAKAPEWKDDNIPYEGTEEQPLSLALDSWVTHSEGKPVVFKMLEGPSWLTLSEDGKLAGTPPEGSYGKLKVKIQATSDSESSRATVRVRIAQKNYPPEFKGEFKFSVKEREKLSEKIRSQFQDRNGDSLTFPTQKGEWWSFEEGRLVAHPQHAHLGKHTLTLKVTDSKSEISFPVTVEVLRNPRAPEWGAIPTSKFLSRETFKLDLAPLARDLDNRPLEFLKVSGPEWVTVSKAQVIANPLDTHAGRHTLTVTVRNDVLGKERDIRLEVIKKNHPPVLVKPLDRTLKEREVFSLDLSKANLISDADGEVLNFSSSNLPSWITLTARGGLKALPLYAHIAKHSFTVSVKDKEQEVELPVTFTVVRNPRSPVWNADGLSLQTLTRKVFSYSLAPLVKDLDGLPVRFAKVTGPDWVTVNAAGELTAKPEDLHVGTHPLEVSATNGELPASKSVRLKVLMQNHAPVAHSDKLSFTLKERSQPRWRLGNLPYFSDSDSDRLHFTSKQTPVWINLEEDGTLKASPLYAHIGKHSFEVTASDGQASVTATVSFTVERNPRPPIWITRSLRIQSKAREPLSYSLAPQSKDLDGLPTTYSKGSGPEWIQVSASGMVSADPDDSKVGRHRFTVSVANDKLASSLPVELEILRKNKPPKWERPSVTMGTTRAGEAFETTVRQLASDPDPQDRLVFEKAKGPAWVTVSADGRITGTPTAKDVGDQSVVLRVLDPEKEAAEMTANVNILQERPVPTPKQNPLRLPEAYVGELFTFSVQSIFQNQEVDFKKVSGPKWLGLRPSGEMTGVPDSAGDFTFSFEASNPRHKITVTGKGQVRP